MALNRTAARLLALAALLCPALTARTLPAQQDSSAAVPVRGEVFANGEMENYLRVLQVRGLVPAYPWSVRAFSPAEVDRLLPAATGHPWAGRYDLARGLAAPKGGLIRPRVQLIGNSAFPYGRNDGPVWAGKGATAAVEAGFWIRRGPVSLTADPMVFVAQNASFALQPTGVAGASPFADPLAPRFVDQPQRFGNGAYWRVDPGQSTLRIDAGPVALGVTTASQQWGPAVEMPLILGSNAPGIPRAFLGTSHPLNVGIGRVHAQVVWGDERQSAYSPAHGDTARRFMTGGAAVFTPRGIPGLEMGASRFFHFASPDYSASEVLRVFQSLLKSGVAHSDTLTSDGGDGSDPDNQLASVFFRWVLPHSGFEVYGEYAKEDHNFNLRDLTLEPDHDAAYELGFRRVWARSDRSWVALRGEVMNAQINHLDQSRTQTRWYIHTREVQGHTVLGQVLGSPAAFGGAGSVVAVDWYGRRGRTTASWYRAARDERFSGPDSDVTHALEVERVSFLRGMELSAKVGGVYDINRNFTKDAFNLNLALGARVSLP
ncbi:MAG TPA: capsule assembly Wzi family protein [Longimicrobiaceae bacterium]|nr:capsule assembly Wzi family protein [Longimicrobiaceae bacterium]